MDAQKIMNKDRDQDQRVDGLCVQLTIQAVANSIHRGRRIVWRKRGEQNEGVALVVRRADEILRILEAPADAFFRVLVEIAMELKNIVGSDRNVRIAGV